MIPNCKPAFSLEEDKATARVRATGWTGRGKEAEVFEQEFSDYISPKGSHYYCLFTNSCTSALKMAYRWFKEQGYRCYLLNNENTYCATYSAAEEVGLINNKLMINNIVKVNIHFGGVKDTSTCDIEDSAHRIEPNDPLIGKIRCYSFHPSKNMTADYGGMFVTDDKEIYNKAKLWILDGIVRTLLGKFDYDVVDFAGGYEGSDIQAAVGRVQLKKLPEFNRKRNELVKRYNEAFRTNWKGNHIFPLYLRDYEEVKKCIIELEEQGIGCKSHYPKSNIMTLPLYSTLSFEEQDEVIKKVTAVCRA